MHAFKNDTQVYYLELMLRTAQNIRVPIKPNMKDQIKKKI